MKIRKLKKIHLIDPKYNSRLIVKFVNKFTKHGKKQKIYNILYNVFKKLKRLFNFNMILFLKIFIKKNKPLVFSKNIMVQGKSFQIPKFLLEHQKEAKVLI